MTDADIFSFLKILIPQVENADQKIAVVLYGKVVLLTAPLLFQRLETGNNLQPTEFLLFIKLVDALDGFRVFSHDYTEDVEFHMAFFKQAHRFHDSVMCPLALIIPAVQVMELCGTVQRQSHEEVVFPKNSAHSSSIQYPLV